MRGVNADASGVYLFEQLDPGEYKLVVNDGMNAYYSALVTVASTTVTRNIKLSTGYSISGTVTQDGSPIYADVLVIGDDYRWYRSTGSDGRYTISGLPAGQYTVFFVNQSLYVASGNISAYWMNATTTTEYYHLAGKVTVPNADVTGINGNLTQRDTATLSGTLRDGEGNSLTGTATDVYIFVYRADAIDRYDYYSFYPDSNGAFNIELPAGDYRLGFYVYDMSGDKWNWSNRYWTSTGPVTSLAAAEVFTLEPGASMEITNVTFETMVPVEVTFDANGGTVATSGKTVTSWKPYGTLPTATRADYTFDGWYTAASGGTVVTAETLVPTGANHTLYAHWTAKTPTGTPQDNTSPSGGDTTPPADTGQKPDKAVTKLRTPLTKIYLKKGTSLTLPVCADSVNPTTKKAETTAKLTWKSSKTKVATVSGSGKIKARAVGTAKITVTAMNGKKLTVTVKVVKKAKVLKKVKVSGVKSTLKKGKTAQVKLKVTPSAATNLKVTFKSSKKSVIKVDKAGKLTALKRGKAKITVKVGKKKVVKTIKVK